MGDQAWPTDTLLLLKLNSQENVKNIDHKIKKEIQKLL